MKLAYIAFTSSDRIFVTSKSNLYRIKGGDLRVPSIGYPKSDVFAIEENPSDEPVSWRSLRNWDATIRRHETV